MSETQSLWYKDAIIYEVHVRAFHDSLGTGRGDFKGLTRKLDYLQDLGITAIWLLPFYPSPLRDDGYDIADYTSIHPQYGTLNDFKEFLHEAHARNLKVITELVVNHTSDQHPWFQRARRAPAGSPERDFYVWSNTPERYQDARIIFKDFELSNWTWDPLAKAYYWHRFYSHQPDLNFDNPAVWEAIFPVMDFWLEMGVDGMRLDAIPYLYEREGTSCENLPETHVFLRALRKHVDERFPDRMFLAEANQWPEDAVAYFGNGDECQMAFHFPVMPRLFMALHQEDRFPILDILAQTPPIPESCQWCLFLRNHDELTLEMVTDEERDYMVRAYAEDKTARINLGIRHRLAPLLKNNRRRIELMNALLFSLPGTPVLYYGDEIGMGDNIYLGDRNGVRTPMQWSSDRNAGFSRANPQRLYLPVIIDPEYHYEAINVENQQNNAQSLLWWMKRLIAMRKRYQAFGRGSIKFLQPDNPRVLAFIREYQDERILVVANLSRFVQYAQLDLHEYVGVVPEEVFGRTPFPPVGEVPYLLTLGPHGFFWLSLRVDQTLLAPGVANRTSDGSGGEVVLPLLRGNGSLAERFQPAAWDALEELLPHYLQRRRIFSHAAVISSAQVEEAVVMQVAGAPTWVLLVRVEYQEEMAETIFVPLTLVPSAGTKDLLLPLQTVGFAEFRQVGKDPVSGFLCDALAVPECNRAILQAILQPPATGQRLELTERSFQAISYGTPEIFVPPAQGEGILGLRASERNNTAIEFDKSFFLKTFRRLEEGINPEQEVSQYLNSRTDYHGTPQLLGCIEYRRRGAEPSTLAVLYRYVVNQGDAWQYTLDQLSSFFERVAAQPRGESREQLQQPPAEAPLVGPDPGRDRQDAGRVSPPSTDWPELVGGFLEIARLLGQRTAELHRALADRSGNSAFAPEPNTRLYQRSFYQSLRTLTGRLCERLKRSRNSLPEAARPMARVLVAQRDTLLQRCRELLATGHGGQRIRCHGDYHLGELLFTGKDFVIIDFEGDTSRTIGERRLKRSPLRDLAGLIRSFDYAVHSVLLGLATSRGQPHGVIRPEDRPRLEPWGHAWFNQVSREVVQAYLQAIASAELLPSSPEAQGNLLELFLLEKALLEVDAELTYRPEWAVIPLHAVLRLLGHEEIV